MVGAEEDTGSSTKHKKKRRRVVIRRTSRLRGVERLFEEADKLLGENAKSWAQLFSKAAHGGDRASVEKLVKLAVQRKKPRAEPVKKPRAELVRKPRPGISVAQGLEEDLRLHGEWVKEVEAEVKETGEVQGTGNRE